MNYVLTGEAKDLLTETKANLADDATSLKTLLDGLDKEITDAPKGTGVDLSPARKLADALIKSAAVGLDRVAASLRPHSPNNDGKDDQGYPLGWNDIPDTHPGAVPPAPGMLPGNPAPENAVSPGVSLGRDPNFSVTGDPATDPKDFAPKDQGASAKAVTDQQGADPNAAPDQQADKSA